MKTDRPFRHVPVPGRVMTAARLRALTVDLPAGAPVYLLLPSGETLAVSEATAGRGAGRLTLALVPEEPAVLEDSP